MGAHQLLLRRMQYCKATDKQSYVKKQNKMKSKLSMHSSLKKKQNTKTYAHMSIPESIPPMNRPIKWDTP